MDPTWMLQSFVDQNPLVWMAEVNGLLVDLRDMPREVQQIAWFCQHSRQRVWAWSDIQPLRGHAASRMASTVADLRRN
jgi:hypothetical protein